MGRMNAALVRYLGAEDWRALAGVEQGMRNHETVPLQLAASLARLKGSAARKKLGELVQHRLVAYDKTGKADGYRLTNLGYDFLALHALQDSLASLGSQIGVGKESDVYLGLDPQGQECVVKFHRLGRTSFRKVKEKRDYHGKRRSPNWLYLSRLAATREAAFMEALAAQTPALPVPTPLGHNRHVLVMSLVPGTPLERVAQVPDVPALFNALNGLILRLGNLGLIHSDFNEFNLLLREDDASPVLIDFPQMVSTSHPNARFYFERDVNCVRDFFKKRFGFEGEEWVEFEDLEEEERRLDVETEASGWVRERLGEDFLSDDEDLLRHDSSFSDTDDDEAPDAVPLHPNVEAAEATDAPRASQPSSHLEAWLASQPSDGAAERPTDGPKEAPLEPAAPAKAEEAAGSGEEADAESVGEAALSMVSRSTIHPEEIRSRLRAQRGRHVRQTTVSAAVKKGAKHNVKLHRRENKETARDTEGWVI